MNAAEIKLADKYQQKTDKQHILDNPDTYIGSVEQVESDVWVLSEDSLRICERNIHYIPALFKLFDEGIVNCRDHAIRMERPLLTVYPTLYQLVISMWPFKRMEPSL